MSDKASDNDNSAPYSVKHEWHQRVQEFKDFRMRFGKIAGNTITGNTTIPFEYKKLQKWATHLRKHREPLSPERVEQLVEIGLFGKNPGIWEVHFSKLCAYKERFGDCKLPCS